MQDFKSRNYWGDKAATAFDDYINSRDGWESRRFGVEDRYSSKDLDWIRNKCISEDVIDEFREHAVSVIGKKRFDRFYKRLSGKIPIPIRWEADRILVYQEQVVAAVDVKGKGKKWDNWSVEVMALLANSQAHLRYGCPVFYAFPPKDYENEFYGHFNYWTIATTQDLTHPTRTEYKDGRFADGSGTDFHVIWQPHVDYKLTNFIEEVESEVELGVESK